jgi:hypothetical protein
VASLFQTLQSAFNMHFMFLCMPHAPAHRTLLDLSVLIISGEDYKL